MIRARQPALFKRFAHSAGKSIHNHNLVSSLGRWQYRVSNQEQNTKAFFSAVANGSASVADRFRVLKKEHLKEINGEVTLLEHKQTGANVLSVVTDDNNKVFGVNFRTLPSNSDGVAHILEHSVLCGSKKYPVKEPFVELLKGSLQTFLNAFTYPDRTCYPVASLNEKDFYNLIDVYIDAAFHPLLTPEKLMQEGWHYELDDDKGKMSLKGVVFNEMKGVYSSPDSLNYRILQQHLFPDNAYGVDSGGDPKDIPTLTWEKFKSFHETCYHPSNALFYFYGDDSPEKRLEIVDNAVKSFQKIPSQAPVELQRRFREPKRVKQPFAATDTKEHDLLTVGWILNEKDIELQESLELELLNELLMGSEAAPLRKALLESKLGYSVIGGGLSTSLRQYSFSVGLKRVSSENVDKVEDVVLQSLDKIANEGFTPEAIGAAINTVEFALRERNTGSFPRGLSTMLVALPAWVYGQNPVDALKFEKPLKKIKERLAAGESVFESLIRERLLNNPHRVTVNLVPDTEHEKRLREEEERALAEHQAKLKEEELEQIANQTKALKDHQLKPDDPEALKCIPSLLLSDLETKQREFPVEVTQSKEVSVLRHSLSTSGIVYVDVGFDLEALPQNLLPLVPLFGRALTGMGTKKHDFVTFKQRIGQHTGGVSTSRYVSSVSPTDPEKVSCHFFLHAKCTGDKLGELSSILHELVHEIDFDNQARFIEMVKNSIGGMQSAITSSGHSIVETRLNYQQDVAGWLGEITSGVEYYYYLKDLLVKAETQWPLIRSELIQLRGLLMHQESMIINVTADENILDRATQSMEGLAGSVPECQSFTDNVTYGISAFTGDGEWSWKDSQAVPSPKSECFVVPTQVNYVGAGGNIFSKGYKYHGSVHVISKFLRDSYLWDRVRVHGGAYGSFSRFSRRSGMLSFLSYRDPNLVETLDIYKGAAEYLAQQGKTLTPEELSKSIIGTIGAIDNDALMPDAQGYRSMIQYLMGETAEERQQRRTEILETSPAHLQEFSHHVRELWKDIRTVSIASDAAVQKANKDGKQTIPSPTVINF